MSWNSFTFNLGSIVTILSIAIAFVSVQAIIRRLIREKLLPKSLNIAILGLERSGKTTFITLLFGDIFANKILNLKAIPTSEATIDRINTDLACILNKQVLKSTKTQDIFGYSANIVIKQKYLSSTIKLMIGDFPGEETEKFVESAEKKLLENTNFRNWCVEADAYIFIIDLAKYLTSREYVAFISSKIRESIQELSLANIKISEDFKKRPILLVFNKADLFNIATSFTSNSDLQNNIINFGYKEIPDTLVMEKQLFDEGVKNVLADFEDLILFFENLENCSGKYFTSGFWIDENGKKVDYEKLMYYLLKNSDVIDNFGNIPLIGLFSHLTKQE